MLDEQYIGQIDDYLDGRLDQDATPAFESEIQKNPALHELVALMKLSRESIKYAGQRELLKQIHREFKESANQAHQPTSFTLKPWWIGIAASFAALFLVGNFWIQTDVNTLYEKTYISYELLTMRSTETQKGELEELYRDQDYEALTSLVDTDSDNPTSLFLAGLSYISLENYESSVQYLQKLEQLNSGKADKDKLFQNETDYYLYLSFLKLGQIDSAEVYFDRIRSYKTHTFHAIFGSLDKLRLAVLKIKEKN